MIGQTQRNFSRGEIGPSLHARVDTVQYAAGLTTARNMQVLRMGGLQSRAGTEFVAEVKDSSKTVRLIPFVFNSSQTYVLEFGNLYMRVHQAGVQLTLTAQNITGITNANPAVLTYSGSDTYANGDEVYVSGVVGPIGTFVNGRNFKVVNVNTGANTFELDYSDGTNVNSTSWGAYTSGGTIAEVYEITTPYVEADLAALNFTQSADVLTITHPGYKPRDLTRSGHTSWTLTAITFAPVQAAPTNLAVATSGTGHNFQYTVTAVDATSGEESYQGVGVVVANKAIPTAAAPHVLTWTTASGADLYRLYGSALGSSGFIGSSSVGEFNYYGATPDFSQSFPDLGTPFGTGGSYADGSGTNPSAICYYQQRKVFANTDADPETFWMTRVGLFTNLTISTPIQADNAVIATLAGGQANEILHLVNNEGLVALTGGGEWLIEGNESGIISPTAINARQKEEFGASTVRPIILNKRILYVDSSGALVREIPPKFDGPIVDRTLFSTHLFDGYTLTDMTGVKMPHPTLYAVRSNGVLLGLTHVPDQEIFGWHRHDTEGTFENVCAVPEGSEWFLYVCVKRTIDGATKRYIERMATRQISDIKDFIGMDAALSYDGRNAGATTMTLSGGSSWLETETLTLTSSSASTPGFTTDDIGNEIHFYDSDDVLLGRFEILGFTSTTVVTGRFDRTVPVALRSTATTTWAEAVDQLTGLWHLEDKAVSVFADGFVLASPNNDAYDTVTVADGSITLDECAAVIHVGLPYFCDTETLDIDSSSGATLAGKKKIVRAVTLHVEETRGLWVGGKAPSDDDDDPLEGLHEPKVRHLEGYDEPVDLVTDKIKMNIQPQWNSNGRVFIRQVDPIPVTILAITPEGDLEGGK